VPFLRFEHQARDAVDEWRLDLETRIRSEDLPPAFESHIAKYRKLVPALALINHLAEGDVGPVKLEAFRRALGFANYLESHAKRAYAAAAKNEATIGSAIMERVCRGSLADGFTARDITQSEWSGLTDTDEVKAGLELLVDRGWLAQHEVRTRGRPSIRYYINPVVFAGAQHA
jgi:Protein of unknown function (DUF3987)